VGRRLGEERSAKPQKNRSWGQWEKRRKEISSRRKMSDRARELGGVGGRGKPGEFTKEKFKKLPSRVKGGEVAEKNGSKTPSVITKGKTGMSKTRKARGRVRAVPWTRIRARRLSGGYEGGVDTTLQLVTEKKGT